MMGRLVFTKWKGDFATGSRGAGVQPDRRCPQPHVHAGELAPPFPGSFALKRTAPASSLSPTPLSLPVLRHHHPTQSSTTFQTGFTSIPAPSPHPAQPVPHDLFSTLLGPPTSGPGL